MKMIISLLLLFCIFNGNFCREEIELETLTLAYYGGSNNQAITEVKFTENNCREISATGGDDFEIKYDIDGNFISQQGDLTKETGGNLGTNFAPGKNSHRIENPDDPELGFYTPFYEQLGSIHQQPRLRYFRPKDTPNTEKNDATFRYWRTYYFSAITNSDVVQGHQGDTRAIDVVPLADNKFISRIWGDDGLALVRSPNDLTADNCACVDNCGDSKGSMFIISQNEKNYQMPKPLFSRTFGFRPDKYIADNDGRVWITDGGQNSNPLNLGGSTNCGISVFDQGLQNLLFESKLGCDNIYSITILDDILVVGGRISEQTANELTQVKGNQQTFGGGDYDAFLGIFKIKVTGNCSFEGLSEPKCGDCYCAAPESSSWDNIGCTSGEFWSCYNYSEFTWIKPGGNPGRSSCGSHSHFGSSIFPGSNQNIVDNPKSLCPNTKTQGTETESPSNTKTQNTETKLSSNTKTEGTETAQTSNTKTQDAETDDSSNTKTQGTETDSPTKENIGTDDQVNEGTQRISLKFFMSSLILLIVMYL